MKKQKFLALMSALICLAMLFCSCKKDKETPVDTTDNTTQQVVATDDEKKQAAIDFVGKFFTTDEDNEKQDITVLFELLKTLSLDVSASAYEGDDTTPVGTVSFIAKDGNIYGNTPDGEGYIFIDNDYNFILVSYEDGKVVSEDIETAEEVLANMDPTGGALNSDAMDAMIESILALDLPKLTKDDLSVSDNKVTISKDYIKNLILYIIDNGQDIFGGSASADTPALMSTDDAITGDTSVRDGIAMFLNSVKLDLSVMVNDSAKITGIAVDFDASDAASILGVTALTANISVSLNPSNTYPTALNAKVSFTPSDSETAYNSEVSLNIGYTENVPTSISADFEINNPKNGYMYYNSNYVNYSANMQVKGSLKLNFANITVSNSDVLSFSLNTTEEITGSEDSAFLNEYNGKKETVAVTASIKNTDSKLIGEIKVDEKAFLSDTPEASSVKIEAATQDVTFPEIPAAVADVKAKADTYISKKADIDATKAALENTVFDVPGYFEYYDATSYAFFDVDVSGELKEVRVWVSFVSSVDADYEDSIIKKGDGTFAVAVK